MENVKKNKKKFKKKGLDAGDMTSQRAGHSTSMHPHPPWRILKQQRLTTVGPLPPKNVSLSLGLSGDLYNGPRLGLVMSQTRAVRRRGPFEKDLSRKRSAQGSPLRRPVTNRTTVAVIFGSGPPSMDGQREAQWGRKLSGGGDTEKSSEKVKVNSPGKVRVRLRCILSLP